MQRKTNIRFSPATPLAAIALFISLGSVSYAAGMIGTADLKNGAVTKKKLHRNSVATRKVINGAITTRKLRNGAVTGPKVVEATLGQVPSAANAAQADSATTADSANTANSADSAQTADAVGPNGVDSAALQTNSVGITELKSNSVGSSELLTGSVGTAELQSSSVHASDLGQTVLRNDIVSVESGDSEFGAAPCGAGEQMLSGGARWGGGELEAAGPFLRIAYSYPLGTNIWAARGYNASGVTRDFIVYALCLDN